jgi:hypothetical protein
VPIYSDLKKPTYSSPGTKLELCLARAVQKFRSYFLTGRRVTALSTVSVSGTGQETAAATIEIAEGTTPLYIVTTGRDPIIWKFVGATDRVESFIAGAGNADVGVVGLAEDRVKFVPADNVCQRPFTKRMAAWRWFAVVRWPAHLNMTSIT